MLVIDTNILLDYPQIIEEEKDNIIIATDVLRELDGLKLSSNFDTSYKARRAAVIISHNINTLQWSEDFENEKIPVDDKLLKIAKLYSATLVTNDVYLKVKAITKHLSTRGYGNSEIYSGIKTLLITPDTNQYDPIIAKIYETGEIPNEISPINEGQYLIIKNSLDAFTNKHGGKDYKVFAIFVCENNKLIEVAAPYERIYNEWIANGKGIGPRNPEQICLFNALANRDKTILYAGGAFGTGKSFILNNFALQELEKGRIKKIVYVPNNAYTENTMDLGALPGELLSKVAGQIGPLVDLVGIDKVQDMMNHDQLEVVPMGSIRGRSFDETIIIVNEAQNLTEDHVKLLIARCGEKSRIFFDGDFKQTDSAIFRNRNGLKLLLNLRKSPIYAKAFATVQLKMTERSLTAQAAAFLDEFTGGI